MYLESGIFGMCKTSWNTKYKNNVNFRLTVIAILFIFSGGCKYCKFRNRQRRETDRDRRCRNAGRFRRRPSPSPDLSSMRSLEMYYCNPRRNELDDLINLRRLLAEQEACNVAIDRYVASQNGL